MSLAYFDSSALVKRYVKEQGSAQVISLMSRHEVLSSAITPVELLSALSRRKRSGDLAAHEFSTLLDRIQNERRRWELVEMISAVLTRAEEVIQGPVPMRALDAIHVASSVVFQTATSVEVPFVTADARQREAARQLGLNVVWVD